MRIHNLVAGAAFTALVIAGPVMGANDYYVHAEAYNPFGGASQPAYITVDWLDGDVLSVPDEACGMRFEGDFTLHWYSEDFGLHDSIPADDGIADVWLPSDDCGAWQGVAVETDDGIYTPPYDFSGYIETYSSAYWINSAGQKLIYSNQPCSPMPSCIQLNDLEFVANGWAEPLGEPIIKLRAAHMILPQSGVDALSAVNHAANALMQAERIIGQRVQIRRTVNTGTLELPMRQLEGAALRRISKARERVRECVSEVGRGNLTLASRACDAALRETLAARAALDTGDAWIDWPAGTTNPQHTSR